MSMEHADLRAQLVREANRLQPLGLATGTVGRGQLGHR